MLRFLLCDSLAACCLLPRQCPALLPCCPRLLSALPLAIELETACGLVGIVHADCPRDDWPCFTIAITGGEHSDHSEWERQHLRTMALVETAADFAIRTLAPGGAFVAKVLAGGTDHALLALLKRHFASVKHAKPPASRKDSSEWYVIAKGFKGGGGEEPAAP